MINTTTKAIVLENVYSGYCQEIDVIKDISFTIEYGQNIAILGSSGSGKSTLLKTIAGIIQARQGNIFLEDTNINHITRFDMARKISMLSQLSSSYFSFSIFDTVMLGRYTHIKGLLSKPSIKDIEVVENVLKIVGLFEIKERSINSLSGGQLQRVFLARTFAQEPSIILLDEPTNHLDIGNQLNLIEYMKEWASVGNRAIVGVLHDINLSFSFADKIMLLKDGSIVFFGDIDSMDKTMLNDIYGTNVIDFMKKSLNAWF